MNILGPFIRNVIFSSFFDIQKNDFRSILRAKNKYVITYGGFKGQILKVTHLLYLHFLKLREVCSDRILWSEPNIPILDQFCSFGPTISKKALTNIFKIVSNQRISYGQLICIRNTYLIVGHQN